MKKIFALLIVLTTGASAAPMTSADRIDAWESAINRSSEAGNMQRAQLLRSELADFCVSIGDYVGALRQYDLLLALRPGRRERVRLFIRSGDMKDRLKNFEGAIAAFQDALHDDADSYDANIHLAREYAKVDLNTRAIHTYQKCIELNPKDSRPYSEIAGVYAHMGFLKKAIAAYEKSLRLSPDPDAYLGMADCYVRTGDIAHATNVLLEAKSVLPRVEYDVRLGDIYHKLGDLARAASAWEEALKVDPKRDDVRLKLVMIYDPLRRRQDTDRTIKKLLADYPNSPLVHFLAAWIWLNRGDKQAAKRETAIVQRLGPTELVQHFDEDLMRQLQQ